MIVVGKRLLVSTITLVSVASTLCAAGFQGGAIDTNGITTMMVDVDGLPLRVRTAGLDGRQRAQAVIILESGGSAPLETWDPILTDVMNIAPVIAYDRAGTGQSGWDSLPPSPERVVARLRRLLVRLDVAPPYVLVGHSWGGALIRYFGGTFPETVAALVYIDPTDITQEPSDEIAIFESIGAGAGARDAFYEMMERAMENAPDALRAEGAVTLSIFRSSVAERGVPAPPEVPTTVILAGKPASFPPSALPFDTRLYAEAVQRYRLEHLRNWVRPAGEFLVATDVGHLVHAEAPALVIEAIRRIVPAR